MTKNPVVAAPEDTLDQAREAMARGRFRRLAVVEKGRLVGILTDRDVLRHEGTGRAVTVGAAMTCNPLSLSPRATVELAAQLMLRHKISGLPVVEEGRLVGIITTTDVMDAFLEVIGAAADGSLRVDFSQGRARDRQDAGGIARRLGGEVLAVGAYRDSSGDPVCYLRVRGVEPGEVSSALEREGFNVLGVHP